MAEKRYILKPADTLDADGQPLNRCYNAARIADRTVDELIGICKGLIADHVINEDEARFLVQWLDEHRRLGQSWPVNVLSERIARMFQDSIIDEQEKQELFELLAQVVGQQKEPSLAALDMSTHLPLTIPAPTIIVPQRRFCFTGKFYFGTRKACAEAITMRGGLIDETVLAGTVYLVIGEIGSRDWIHSTHGRKIEAAIEWNSKGSGISIVSEEHWADAVSKT